MTWRSSIGSLYTRLTGWYESCQRVCSLGGDFSLGRVSSVIVTASRPAVITSSHTVHHASSSFSQSLVSGWLGYRQPLSGFRLAMLLSALASGKARGSRH